MPRKRKNDTGIPDFELNALARALFPTIQALFEDENIQNEFEEWLKERQGEITSKDETQ